MLVVADDRLSASLLKRGLTAPHFPDSPDAFHKITPAGMRVLADAYEAGELQQFFKPFPREKAAQAS